MQAVEARKQAEEIANELAMLLAHEHRRAVAEQARREAAEAELDRERAAREQAEAQLHELSDLMLDERPAPRFVPAPRGTPRPRGVLQSLP